MPTVVSGSSRFDVRSSLDQVLASFSDARYYAQGKVLSLFDTRAYAQVQVLSLFDARAYAHGNIASRFGINSTKSVSFSSRNFSLYLDGWNIYRRDVSTGTETFLGFIALTDSPKKLTDIAISDGTYEFTARAVSLFWDDCRDGKRKTAKILSGVVDWSDLPIIQNLRREFDKAFRPVLYWEVNTDYVNQTLVFGIWFDPAPSIDISGTPDDTIPLFEEQGEYSYVYEQTVTQYVAVAVIAEDGERGEKAEIQIVWSSATPDSPYRQFPSKEEVENLE